MSFVDKKVKKITTMPKQMWVSVVAAGKRVASNMYLAKELRTKLLTTVFISHNSYEVDVHRKKAREKVFAGNDFN